MNLVIEYTAGDGYTFNCTETIPIEYESPEKLYCDLIELAKIHKKDGWFIFCHQEYWNPEYFVDGDFNVYKLEEWFEKNKVST